VMLEAPSRRLHCGCLERIPATDPRDVCTGTTSNPSSTSSFARRCFRPSASADEMMRFAHARKMTPALAVRDVPPDVRHCRITRRHAP
jgi:hypothetical protein